MKNVLILCLLMVAAFMNAQDNIQWRGTDRTGIYNEEGLLKQWPAEGPELSWHYDGLGDGHSSVAIDDDKIYLTGMTDSIGYLYVLDMSGKLLDKVKYGGEWSKNYEGPRGTVTIDSGKIYIISGIGTLYCLNQKSLELVWKKDLFKEYDGKNITWGINEAPLIVKDLVIATPGGEKHNLIALNKKTGKLVWSAAGEGDLSAYCSPLYIEEHNIIVTMTANHIIGVDAKSGVKLWSVEQKNRWSVHANTPVYSDGMILCTSGYGKGSAMLKLSGGGKLVEEVWFSELLDNRMGSMVKIGDYAYGSGDKNRYWFCVDWKTGEIKYQEKGLAMGNIISNDGMLYMYTDRGEVILAKVNPDKLDIVSRFSVTMGTAQHWAHPVIYNGVLFVRHGDTLMAYNIK
ncbi:outer membrane protein assembly factor BamB family protein [Carboxylicivirga marina]|uniref:PQQ-binding-like beta-propeller repeat protein n=1 Tax=Carboxylicivirga marina TaxID=2800988 RepID=A0ABS1HHH7_9BACT|nr:PQQ-binding-like beta-propeller repeat protein [Carboxylicivirga marina]MBK3517113.1 PQQ-binding-like beta-propeller repeat protein [Carboxylicivirga marina]